MNEYSEKLKIVVSEFFSFKKYFHVHVLLVSITVFTITFSYLAIQKHNAFASGYDLGNMDQTVWNTLNGRFFSFTLGEDTVSRFSIHTDLFLVLIAPLYYFFPNVRTLLVLQAFLLALGAVPVYLITHNLLQSRRIGLIFAVIYLLNPAIQWTSLYDLSSPY